jgi:putative hydrolase of the HAD superfamily
MIKIPSKIKAIFFDAGGTLITPYPSVGKIYSKAAKRYGSECDSSVLEEGFESAWRKRGGLSSLGRDISPENERKWWRSLVQEVFLPYPNISNFDALFDHLHESFVKKELWEVYPEVINTLVVLRQRGLVLGIVSNWDLRLPVVIDNLGLTDYFDFVLGSSACGATKPSSQIFEEALRRADAESIETVHVGDTYHEDYLGAEQAGICAIHLDRNGTHAHVPDESKIRTLEELIMRLNP